MERQFRAHFVIFRLFKNCPDLINPTDSVQTEFQLQKVNVYLFGNSAIPKWQVSFIWQKSFGNKTTEQIIKNNAEEINNSE